MRKRFGLLLFLSAIALARTTAGGYGAFGPTLALLNYDDINTTFQHYGFTNLNSRHWLFGGGGYALANRVLIGGAGWGGTQSVTSESLNLLCRVNYGGGEFRVGYAILDFKHLLVIAGLGIGGGGYSISLSPENRTVPSFDSLLAHPGRTSTLNFSGFNLNPQLAVILPVSFVGLELRAGYNLGPLGANWGLEDGGTLLRGPQMPDSNLWLSLNVIFGGFSHEKTKLKSRIEIEGGNAPEESPQRDETPAEQK
ncbi:MAG: hypothetical protein ABIK54_00930 [candidate division WOR-3 bacterium]